MSQLIAYHGNPQIKQEYLARVSGHVAADELIKGEYWQNGKGCAVGCTIHGSDHGRYEIELGIPRILARLEDGIFERLPNGHAKAWPGKFLSVIAVGADLSLVWPRFAVWLLADEKDGVIRFARTGAQKKVIQGVAAAYAAVVAGATLDSQDWRGLRRAAYAPFAAAADAADAAAAADADADADADAAAFAAADADADAGIRQSKKLLKLLASAPVLEAA